MTAPNNNYVEPMSHEELHADEGNREQECVLLKPSPQSIPAGQLREINNEHVEKDNRNECDAEKETKEGC